jgi:hypothetical protein
LARQRVSSLITHAAVRAALSTSAPRWACRYSAASEQQQPVRGARGPAVRDAIAEPGARRNMARTALGRVETIRPAS